jgi:branched-chain amino acid transport system substrate-binding protein
MSRSGIFLLATGLACATLAWAETAPAPAPESTGLRLGAVLPLSGEAAMFGASAKQGIELAVAEWNAKGGVAGGRIKLFVGDDHGDPARGVEAVTALIEQDHVAAVVGAVMSKVSLACGPICQLAQVPMVSPSSTNPKVTLVGDFIFRACIIDPFQGTLGAKFAYEDLRARKVACLFDEGNDYTKGLSSAFRAKFTALGGQVNGFASHPSGITQFKPQLTQLLAAKPDLLYTSDYYKEVALIALQARELGFTGPILGGDGWDSPRLAQVAGHAIDGCFFTNHYALDNPDTAYQAFVGRFRAAFDCDPDQLAACGYEAANLVLDAANRAGSNAGPAIRDALKEAGFQGLLGTIRLDADRNPVKPAVVLELRNGKPVYRATVAP